VSSLQHPAERGGSERAGGAFERFSQAASNFTSSPVFYAFCVILVLAFVVVHAADVDLHWQLGIDGGMSAITLLLLALLKNSENQTEHAIQTKLDAIARVLLDRGEAENEEAHRQLREAIEHDKEV
jgi:low affinity Fe/Cu permease